ncbi:DUF4974 domain-containing protein [Niabella sp. W65]|nr:DUF4974 domain-containing protein [Niabella sp. W65]MCH7365131.1 DUF4974 domain-containing protein [Niabella sp. W65]ULT40948.1 DUF4974 domain-containing protein [Niabella sp. I65]
MVRPVGSVPRQKAGGTYSGKIERKLTLRQVLNLLQADNIRYTIKPGNQIEIESL